MGVLNLFSADVCRIYEQKPSAINEQSLRMVRFMTNALLMAGGYPMAAVHLGVWIQYLSALERVPTRGDIDDFAAVIAQEIADRVRRIRTVLVRSLVADLP